MAWKNKPNRLSFGLDHIVMHKAYHWYDYGVGDSFLEFL